MVVSHRWWVLILLKPAIKYGRITNSPEEDVWVARRWIAEQGIHTQHRVLPKRLAEPINRLIAVVSDLRRNHETST